MGDLVTIDYWDHFFTTEIDLTDESGLKKINDGCILTAWGEVVYENEVYLFLANGRALHEGEITNQIEGIVKSCVKAWGKLKRTRRKQD